VIPDLAIFVEQTHGQTHGQTHNDKYTMLAKRRALKTGHVTLTMPLLG